MLLRDVVPIASYRSIIYSLGILWQASRNTQVRLNRTAPEQTICIWHVRACVWLGTGQVDGETHSILMIADKWVKPKCAGMK